MENFTAISSLHELKNALGTDDQGSGTECGWIIFNNQELYVRKHWSYSGGYPVYIDERCIDSIGEFEIVESTERKYIIDGVQQMCRHGLYELIDFDLTINTSK